MINVFMLIPSRKKAFRADRKIKTIAGGLVRKLEHNLGENSMYSSQISLFYRILYQRKNSKDKIDSFHEHIIDRKDAGFVSRRQD